MSEAREITRKAKSNLAFALLSLPKENREDVTVFYAFCRCIDDIADDLGTSLADKKSGLEHWRQVLRGEVPSPTPLEQAVLTLREKHAIPREHFLNLIEGCEMDLHPQRFQTWEDLQTYTHRVASTVGLVCLPLFGARHPDSPAYAETLGHALQLTNILRDVGEDLDNGNRIYLPLADLARFDYHEDDLVAKVYDDRFRALMQFQADRASQLYAQALSLLPAADRDPLLAAEIMRSLYQRLLEKMEEDGFRVFDRRYRLSKGRKIGTLFVQGLLTRFSAR
ncbi:phytoene/squalene synthase family protein [Roseibacillus ishigakijimensis]|uniref:Squalene/phytoene synthase family protein n=1 Tax=Roseibacillus ishigakijimensis TaxID=454146 RepID=A0A934RQJ1_9BACT|nr:squalene/phytoene synthase family protein [Roseibacillus ishigakijimensis]MBK1833756.1 squalene/phytoene synthase family protein [Roseibacillus ishigakijimensis]